MPPAKVDRPDVRNSWNLAYSAIGEPVDKWGVKMDDTSEDFAFAKRWSEAVEGLLEEKKLKPHPVKVEKGLEKVFEGLDALRAWRISGEKWVYVL